jgi:hypothetical protein
MNNLFAQVSFEVRNNDLLLHFRLALPNQVLLGSLHDLCSDFLFHEVSYLLKQGVMALLAERFNFLVIGAVPRFLLKLRHIVSMNAFAQVLCGPVMKVLVKVLIIHLVHDLLAEAYVVLLQLLLYQSRVFVDLSKSNRLRLGFGDHLCGLIDVFVDFLTNDVEDIVVDLAEFPVEVLSENIQPVSKIFVQGYAAVVLFIYQVHLSVKSLLGELVDIRGRGHINCLLLLFWTHIHLLHQQSPWRRRPRILLYKFRFCLLEEMLELMVELVIPKLRVETLHLIPYRLSYETFAIELCVAKKILSSQPTFNL